MACFFFGDNLPLYVAYKNNHKLVKWPTYIVYYLIGIPKTHWLCVLLAHEEVFLFNMYFFVCSPITLDLNASYFVVINIRMVITFIRCQLTNDFNFTVDTYFQQTFRKTKKNKWTWFGTLSASWPWN